MRFSTQPLFLLILPLALGCNFGSPLGGILPKKGTPGSLHTGEKQYFVIEESGERRSVGYRTARESTFRGQPCVVSERVTTQTLIREGRSYTSTTRRKVIEALSGAALFAQETRMAGGERVREDITIANGEALFESVGPGGTETARVAVPAGVMFGIGGEWLVKQKLAPGAVFRQEILDRRQKRVIQETVTILRSERQDVLGTPTPVWVAEYAGEGRAPQQMVFTDRGEFVRFADDNLVVRVVSQAEAEETPKPLTVVSTIATNFSLPAWDYFTGMTFALLPGEAWLPYLKSSSYQKVSQRDGVVTVELLRNTPRVRTVSLPLQIPPELQPFLATSESIFPSKSAIQERARQIVRGETDVLRAVALLAGWVHQTVRFQATGSLNQSPIQTLESASGDCGEHANLFASLARSLGIPTRRCHGLLIQKDEAVYHAWVEAWIAGTWVPVDTTVNRVGLPAGYLLTAIGGGDGAPQDEFGWFMRKGGLSLEMLAATKTESARVDGVVQRFNHTLTPNQKRTYFVAQGSRLMSLYWGFSIDCPANWKGHVDKNMMVSLSSPDRQSRVIIEGLPQDYRASTTGLELISESLKRSMEAYREIDARIIPFGQGRTTDTLFIDFTTGPKEQTLRCQQYIVPKRGRSYRIAIWAPAASFENYLEAIQGILTTIEL